MTETTLKKQMDKFKKLVPKYKELGVQTILVEYMGSSDNGQIDLILYKNAADEEIWSDDSYRKSKPHPLEGTLLKKALLRTHYLTRHNGALATEDEWTDASPNEVVEHLTYLLLPSGWEINEGSQGTILFDLGDKPKVVVDHGWNVLEVQVEESEYDL